MSEHDPKATLQQLRDAAIHAQELCAAQTYDSLAKDWIALAALERFIEIMGEAVKRLPVEFRSRYPEIPWQEIAGTRDHLVHGYDDIDHQILWDAVKNDIPSLVKVLDQALKDHL